MTKKFKIKEISALSEEGKLVFEALRLFSETAEMNNILPNAALTALCVMLGQYGVLIDMDYQQLEKIMKTQLKFAYTQFKEGKENAAI